MFPFNYHHLLIQLTYSLVAVFKVGSTAEQSLPSSTYDPNKEDKHMVGVKKNSKRVKI